jgi:hypothetical protein
MGKLGNVQKPDVVFQRGWGGDVELAGSVDRQMTIDEGGNVLCGA